jgi:hypothetical protein
MYEDTEYGYEDNSYDFFIYEPKTPTEEADYTAGARDAWEAHELIGDTTNQLEDRFKWLVDPTVSGSPEPGGSKYTAAYCAGYRSQIENFRASDWLTTTLNANLSATGDAR